MDKATFATALIALVFGYFALNERGRIEVKLFAVWCSMGVLIISHSHSIYLLATNDAPMTIFRMLTLNLAATGMLVLVATGVILKKYLPEHWLGK